MTTMLKGDYRTIVTQTNVSLQYSISGSFTAALCVYSATFMRYSYAESPVLLRLPCDLFDIHMMNGIQWDTMFTVMRTVYK